VQLNLLGTHNVSNAMAAAAAAHAVGRALFGIATGLGAVQPVKGRTVAQLAPNGMRVIDDTYNANPTSMCAAIDILAGFSGRTVLVLGDIGELGNGRKKATARWATTPVARSMRFTRSGQHGPRRQGFRRHGRHFARKLS
jgi:UDP-N-acetylmuramyl pentapeptide synthase